MEVKKAETILWPKRFGVICEIWYLAEYIAISQLKNNVKIIKRGCSLSSV